MEFNQEIIAEEKIKKYYNNLTKKIKEQYDIAVKAKAIGKDFLKEVEPLPTKDVGDRAEKILGLKGIGKRYNELMKELKGNRLKVTFKLFEEIIKQKWCSIEDESERISKAIKNCLLIETSGVVVSPLDGLPEVKISKNFDGSKYIDVYYAGPIRAAGGKAAILPLVLGDYARILMKLDKYKPTEEEVERYVEEVRLYQTEVVSRQITLKDEEIRLIAKNCPVCINGIPTEELEVTAHRDLERIPSNRLRGGIGLVITEGIALKAFNVMKYAEMLGLDWNWLKKIVKVEKKGKKIELKPNYKYLDRIAAGRPLLSYPSKYGGFRLRYGRARNTGLMAKAINPATMYLLDNFIAVGTHIKIERPGKAAQLFPCDSIDGPIILLKNGNVIKANSSKKAIEFKNEIKKILFLGDILVSYGDFRKSGHPLVPAGYTEEEFELELKEKLKENNFKEEEIKKETNKLKEIKGSEAIKLSENYGVSLHPKYIHYYTALNKEELIYLINKIKNAKTFNEKDELETLIEFDARLKEILEKIGLPHEMTKENKILIGKEFAFTFLKTIGFFEENLEEKIKAIKENENILKILTRLSGLTIKDKAGTFVGVRMGRPEAARERKMKGSPQALFPIGLAGGPTRNITKAIEGKKIETEIAVFFCEKCNKIIEAFVCPYCKSRTKQLKICPYCKKLFEFKKEECIKCKTKLKNYIEKKIELKELIEITVKKMGIKLPKTFKGVRGLISERKIFEPIEKGLLRAKNNLFVFRDGTTRFELLNATITHFKPKELNLSIEKLKELGYETDIKGKEINNEEQIIELFPQDIIVNESAGDWLVRVSKFIDELLEKYYDLKAYYNAEKKEDLIGELVSGLAPHTSAAIVGRVIGYSKSRLGWGHPYFITYKRRNVDGDQDSIMLFLDHLLNFSNAFLSNKSGGRMDAPIIFTSILDPSEVDDEVHEMETCNEYNLEFYKKARELSSPFLDIIPIVENKLKKEEQYTGLNYTHEINIFDEGPKKSNYVELKTMEEKITRQAKLHEKIKAIELKDSLERVLVSHFIPDIIGNARAFARQNFRCTKCHAKYRRPPLKGTCKCGNKLILTVAEGSVKKYLNIAKNLIKNYELSNYFKQRIELIEEEINTLFLEKKSKEQKTIADFLAIQN